MLGEVSEGDIEENITLIQMLKIQKKGRDLSDYMEVDKNYINGAELRELNSLGVTVKIVRGTIEENSCSYQEKKCM